MFTGIIEEIGAVVLAAPDGGNLRLDIAAPLVCGDLHVGDSVAVNGVCLTAIRCDAKTFSAEAVRKTVATSGISALRPGSPVNLERALRADGRLGGHFVQGHVDCISRVAALRSGAGDRLVDVELPASFAGLVIPKGSIAVDGVSLTVAELASDRFTVAVIPHTWEHTIFRTLRAGQDVNLEFDVLGKYIRRSMETQTGGATLTAEKLRSLGL